MTDSLNFPPERLPMPSDWQILYLVFLYRSETPAASQPEIMQQHTQYLIRLQASGKAVAAGDLSTGSLESRTSCELAGMIILRSLSAQEAEAIAGADPAVRAGIFTAEVRSWNIPAGRLVPGIW